MKLRMQANSIRLRLKRGEVERLVKTGCVEEAIVFGEGAGEVLRYVLETSAEAEAPRASLGAGEIRVQIPTATAARWAGDDQQVGIEHFQSVDEARQLQILIEKDFACLTGPPEQNVDTFPNPLAGTKC